MTKYDRYEVGALVDLLPGWSGQSRFLHGLYAMASMLIFGALLLVAIATFTFEKDGSSSQSGIVALSLLVGMLISLAWSLIALWMLPYRAEDEERAGYTTLRFRRTRLPLVDHRTGAIMRPAGAGRLDHREARAVRRAIRAAVDQRSTQGAGLIHDRCDNGLAQSRGHRSSSLADALAEVQQVRAFRVRAALLGLPVVLIGMGLVLLTRRSGGEPLVAALWAPGVAMLVVLLMVWMCSGLARRVERRMAVLRQNDPTSDIFAVASAAPGLKQWIEKKDAILAVGNYLLVVADETGLWFLSSQSERRAGVTWPDVEEVSVVCVSERFFHRRALRVSTADGSIDLAPYGRQGAFGLRPASDETAASLLVSLRDRARATGVGVG
jgi:hypothetical protein